MFNFLIHVHVFGFEWYLLDLYIALGHQLVEQNEDGAAEKTVSQPLWRQLASHIYNHGGYSCPIVGLVCCTIVPFPCCTTGTFSSHIIYSSVILHSLSLAFQWNQYNGGLEKENSFASKHACDAMHHKYGCLVRSLRKASFLLEIPDESFSISNTFFLILSDSRRKSKKSSLYIIPLYGLALGLKRMNKLS